MWLEQREVGSGRTEVREVAGEQITWGRIVHSTAANEVSRGRTRSHLHFNRLTLAHEWRTHYMEQSEDTVGAWIGYSSGHASSSCQIT